MNALRLTVLKAGNQVHEMDLDGAKPSLVVGRDAQADIRLEDRAVSRSHAVIESGAGGVWRLKRTSEFGKIMVNGADATEASLKAGDVISIADYQLRLEGKAGGAQPEAAAGAPAAPDAEAHPVLAATVDVKTPPQGTPAPEAAPEVLPDMAAPPSPEIPGFEAPPPMDAAPDMAMAPPPPGEFAGESERTAMVSTAEIAVKLIFKAGEANVEEFPVTKAEVSIGRGSACDVVIEDKKASRKHALVVKVGSGFVLKDLGSANGTYVNGIKVSEQELAGEDVIKIGSTEFTFKAVNQDYFAQESQGAFLQAPAEEAAAAPLDAALPAIDIASMPQGADLAMVDASGAALPGLSPDPAAAMGMPLAGMGAAAIPGMNAAPPGPPEKKSLFQKYKELPKNKKLMVLAVIVMAMGYMSQMQDEEEAAKIAAAKKKLQQQAMKADPTAADYSKLPKEKREFVDQTYGLAMDYYTRGKYDESIHECDKVLEVLPGGFKDIKEIRTYAEQGRETLRLQAEQEEKKRAEEKRKQTVMALVNQAQEYYDKGMEAEVREVFSRILELDPDNPTVAKLKASLDEKEQQKRLLEEQKRAIEAMREAMQGVLAAGDGLRASGQYYEAIDKYLEVPGAGTDKALLDEAKERVADTRKELEEKRQPHVDAANSAYEAKEYEKSRNEFMEALAIDPRCEACTLGIARIRRDVHERAQKIYIEAIIAESVSDLDAAKRKYLECYRASVPEDDYYGRCWRRYHRFVTWDGDASDPSVRAPASMLYEDPNTKEILESPL